MDGGIKKLMLDAAATEPSDRTSSYPYFRIAGVAAFANAAAAARVEPETAPKAVPAIIVAIAKLPGKRPIHFSIAENSSETNPLSVKILAIKRKHGIIINK
jgi:hypothetical protein